MNMVGPTYKRVYDCLCVDRSITLTKKEKKYTQTSVFMLSIS